MSYEYRPQKKISFDSLTNERLEKYGVRVEGRGSHALVIGHDGTLTATREGNSVHLEHHNGVRPMAAFKALAAEFGTEFFSEDDHQFWGYATEAQMMASFKAVSASRRSSHLQGSNCVLTEGPCASDAEFAGQWIQSANEADRLLQAYFENNPSFRPKIARLEIDHDFELAKSTMFFVKLWLSEVDTFYLHLLDSEWGEVFFVMTSIGFFTLTGDRYQMTEVVPVYGTVWRQG